MKPHFLLQLRIVFTIWVLAIVANSLLGTLLLSFTTRGMVYDLLIFGTIYGTFASFPIFLLLLVIVNRCVVTKQKGLKVFRIILAAGIILTVITSILFHLSTGLFPNKVLLLSCIAVAAAVISICAHYNVLLKLEQQISENWLYED